MAIKDPKKTIENLKNENKLRLKRAEGDLEFAGIITSSQKTSAQNLIKSTQPPSWELALQKSGSYATRADGNIKIGSTYNQFKTSVSEASFHHLAQKPYIQGPHHNLSASPNLSTTIGLPPHSSMRLDFSQNKPMFNAATAKTTAALKSDDSSQKLITSLDRLSQKIDQLTQKIPGGGAGGSGGGGAGGAGGGGVGRRPRRKGEEDEGSISQRVFGSPLKAAFADAIGKAVIGGFDYSLNKGVQEATAPIQSYSNMGRLQGFQQQRFLRDFSSFDAESLILRKANLRFAGGDALLKRIDPIAKEASKKQDEAEKSRNFFDSLKSIGSDALSGAGLGLIAGSAAAGIGAVPGAIVGGLIGGATGLIKQIASSPSNAAYQRSGMLGNDLRIKGQSEFDTATITANIQALEEAEKDRNRISIAALGEYEKTLPSRIAAGEQGRFLDLTSQMGSKAFQAGFSVQSFEQREDVKDAARASALILKSNFQGDSFKASNGRTYYKNMNDDPRVRAASAGQNLKNIKNMFDADSGLTGVLQNMGIAAGSAEGVALMSQFGNIGGAGAKGISGTQDEVNAFKKIKGMSQSGLGSAQQLLGQAGILGRITGGVSETGNIKKLEEVMSRAVASGMNNSELTSAFMQNVTSKAAEMGSGNISDVARLVQKMQMAGGGQLVDYDRMQKSLTGTDAASKQNEYVKANIRSNMFSTIEKNSTFRGERAAIVAGNIENMSTQSLSNLAVAAERFAKTGKIDKRAGAEINNLLMNVGRNEAKNFSQAFVNQIKGDRIAGMLGVSREQFKQEYGVDPSEYNSLSNEQKVAIRNRASMNKGFDASAFEDTATFSASQDDYGKKDPQDKKKISEAERRLGTEQAKAKAKNALTAMGAVKDEKSSDFLGKFLKTRGAPGSKTLKELSEDTALGSVVKGLGLQTDTQYGIAEKIIRGESLNKDEETVAKQLKMRENLSKTQFQLSEKGADAEVQTPEERASGAFTKENAAELGAAFAKAFFEYNSPGAKERRQEVGATNSKAAGQTSR